MPMIEADIRRGRTQQQRDQLMRDLTQIVHEVSRAPLGTYSAEGRPAP